MRLSQWANRSRYTQELYLQLTTIIRPFFFFNEILLSKGIVTSKGRDSSILLLTTFKCGSTYTKSILHQLLSSKGNYKTINYSTYYPYFKRQKLFADSRIVKSIHPSKGYFFGAYKEPLNLPNSEDYKILLSLRDPRDVLTSHYFSTVFSHPPTNRKLLEERELYQSFSIDEFVLHRANDLNKTYTSYQEYLGNTNVLHLKYEDMISDFEYWLSSIYNFLQLKKDDQFADLLDKNSKIKPGKSKYSFVRSIRSGNYKEKLKAETIIALNEIFSDTLKAYGYEVQ